MVRARSDSARSVSALLASLLTSSMATATLDTVLGIQVFAISGRPLDLGLLGLFAFAPSLLFVLVTGAVADRFDRRWVVAVAHVVAGRVRRRTVRLPRQRADECRSDLRGRVRVRCGARLRRSTRPRAPGRHRRRRTGAVGRGAVVGDVADRDDPRTGAGRIPVRGGPPTPLRRRVPRSSSSAARSCSRCLPCLGVAHRSRPFPRLSPASWSRRRPRAHTCPKRSKVSGSSAAARSFSARSRSTCSRCCSEVRSRCSPRSRRSDSASDRSASGGCAPPAASAPRRSPCTSRCVRCSAGSAAGC